MDGIHKIHPARVATRADLRAAKGGWNTAARGVGRLNYLREPGVLNGRSPFSTTISRAPWKPGSSVSLTASR